jgi:hypothetical protein
MPCKIIPAVGHATVIFGLVLDRGPQLNSDPMAITAIALPMTGGTDETEPSGHRAMIFPKKHAVIEFFIWNLPILRIMAIRAKPQIFTVFFRMPGWRCITALKCGTGSYQHDKPEAYAYS